MRFLKSIFRTTFFTALFAVFVVTIKAQGIAFESGDMAAVRKTASEAHKLVYLEFYTSWCGPCKMLEKKIFTDGMAGAAYNKQFVNFRLDAEKGEGVALAKRYGVAGYPTHVFIDPGTGEAVFRDQGAPDNAAAFIKNGTTALEEWKTPQSWESYAAAFDAKHTDTAFLKQYLAKAKTLGKNNDRVINAYVDVITQNNWVSLAELNFLADNLQTLDNKGIGLLWKHRALLDQAHAAQPDYTVGHVKNRLYPTMEKAAHTGDESLLNLISNAEKTYFPDEQRGEIYWYRTHYFMKIGDEARATKAADEEARFLLSRTPDWYFQKDQRDQEKVMRDMRAILHLMQVPEKDIDARMQRNLSRNPSRLHPYSTIAALWLNDLSMNIYEHDTANPKWVQQALRWSARAMELTKPSPDFWPAFTDTHARLLYGSGDRDKAIEEMRSALAVAKTVPEGGSTVSSLQETLDKMSAGLRK